MTRVAIVYDTVSGSTAEMGEVLHAALQGPFGVARMPIVEVTSLAEYDAVVIGSPMRFGGFTPTAERFIRRHRAELERKKVAYFFSMLYVVRIAEEGGPGVLPYIDPGLAMATIPRKRATIMDRTHSLDYFERQRRRSAPGIQPVSVAYFKGRLNVRRLPLKERLFMRIVTSLTSKEREGEFMNPSSVKGWAAELQRALA